MKKFTRLVPAAAVLAATLATPTAAAADVCASVGYSLLGSGTDIKRCHNTGFSTVSQDTGAGDPNSAQVRVGYTVPVPLPSRDEHPDLAVAARLLSGAVANRVL